MRQYFVTLREPFTSYCFVVFAISKKEVERYCDHYLPLLWLDISLEEPYQTVIGDTVFLDDKNPGPPQSLRHNDIL